MLPFIHRVYSQIFRVWRAKRGDVFLRRVQPTKEKTILDVGGYPFFWTSAPCPVSRIDTLNLHKVPFDQSQFPHHNIRVLEGNGCALPFSENSYDIVFSNSVIEHVGNWERQQEFAREVRRVG